MTQDISSMLAENEPCMWGSATLVMLVSSTCITVTIITDSVMAHLRPVLIGASSLTAAGRDWPRAGLSLRRRDGRPTRGGTARPIARGALGPSTWGCGGG